MSKILIILIPLLFASCIGVKTSSAYDPKATFDDYKTFGWIEELGKNYQGPEYRFSEERREMLMEVMTEVLESKGIEFNQEQPDLLLGYYTIVEEKEVLLDKNDEMGDPYNRQIKYWDDYENYHNQEVHRFLKGTLIIDLIDTQSETVIWQSTAKRYMEQFPSVTRLDMKRAIEKTLKDFPPESE